MSRRHRELGLRRGRGCAESLYSMINLDKVQDGLPLRLTHPTPCHGRFNRRRWANARSFSQPARSQPVTSESRDESHRRKYVKLQVWTMR
jgi:hypothetical protein